MKIVINSNSFLKRFYLMNLSFGYGIQSYKCYFANLESKLERVLKLRPFLKFFIYSRIIFLCLNVLKLLLELTHL